MKKIYLFFLLSCLFVLGTVSKSNATHVAAADIYYEYLAPLTYRVHLVLYRDCKPGNAGLSGITQMSASSVSCAQNINFTVDTNGWNTRKIYGDLCPNINNWCVDPNSIFPGYEEWHYDTVVVLPMACSDWKFTYNNMCCRNNAISNLQTPGGQGICVNATLNNVLRPVNSSAFLSIKPIPYVCVNQPKTYLNGPLDPDLDSLVFVASDALNWTTCASIPWTNGGTTANPLGAAAPGGYVVDPNTGTATFTPIAVNTYVMAFTCTEYDIPSGQPVGSVQRDVQINVLNCAAAPPSDPNLTQNYNLLNVVGATLQSPNPIQLTVCPGTPMSFDIQAVSNSQNNNILTYANNAISCPGSNYVMSPIAGGNPVTGTFTWTPTAAQSGPHTLIITFVDSTCTVSQPIVLKSYAVILINVLPLSVSAGPDLVRCLGGDSVQFSVIGPAGSNIWSWTDVNGNTNNIGMSNLNIQNPKAAPDVTTDYIITVTATTNANCSARDTIQVLVDNSTVDATTSPQVLCEPGLVTLTGTPTGFSPIYNCGEENVPCTTPFSLYTVGTGATSNVALTPFPAGTNSGTRSQMLYTVADLNALGVLKGRIESIALDVATKNSVAPYDLTIKMGCTPLTQLSSFIPSSELKTVYTNGNYSTVLGWNTFLLNTPFLWDGVQNLVVEICYYNGQNNLIGDDAVNYTTTANPQFYSQSSNFGGCYIPNVQAPTTPIVSTALPNARFSICDMPVKSWPFRWDPGTFVFDSTAGVTTAYVNSTTTFNVYTKTKHNCEIKDSVTVSISQHDVKATPVDTVFCEGDSYQPIATGWGNAQSETFLWFEQNGSSSTFSCTNCPNPIITPPAAGTYTYTCTRLDSYGCGDTVNITVKVNPRPNVTILNGDSIKIKYAKQEVNLVATGASVYNWSPVWGLSNPNIGTTVAAPAEPTLYYVYGLNSNGCRNWDSIYIDIDYHDNLWVPTAFSPNGDGNNDLFRVANLTFQNIQEFKVVNRWGQELFSANDNKGWNGTFKGKPQDPATYFYLIRVAYPDGSTKLFKGDLILIR